MDLPEFALVHYRRIAPGSPSSDGTTTIMNYQYLSDDPLTNSAEEQLFKGLPDVGDLSADVAELRLGLAVRSQGRKEVRQQGVYHRPACVL